MHRGNRTASYGCARQIIAKGVARFILGTGESRIGLKHTGSIPNASAAGALPSFVAAARPNEALALGVIETLFKTAPDISRSPPSRPWPGLDSSFPPSLDPETHTLKPAHERRQCTCRPAI
jgi:hypothetical protein